MQIDDLNEINVYLRTANPKTPSALKVQIEWKPWFSSLSWYQKTTDSNVLKEAQTRRYAFIRANTKGNMATRLTIKQGSTGTNVKELQTILKLTPVDGIFGKNTKAAVEKFQSSHGLKADGIVGPNTWTALLAPNPQVFVQAAAQQAKAVDAVKAAVAVTPAQKAALGVPTPATSSSTLRLGSTGQPVKDWQKFLGIAQTGTFDANTVARTKDWQNKHGLNGDGVVGPATKAAAMVAPKVSQPVSVTSVVESVKAAPAKAVAAAKAAPAAAVKAAKAAPQRVSNAITGTIAAVAPKSVTKLPVWAQVAVTFVAGAVGVSGYRKFIKKA